MKTTITTIALLFCLSSQAQETVDLKLEQSGKHLQQASNNFFIGLTIQVLGAAMIASSQGDDTMIKGGTAFALSGFVFQVTSFNHIGRAGRKMRNTK
jgi:hypothetical protein